MFLRELVQPIQYLKGVGPKYSTLLSKLGILRICDLILHFPRSYIDRTNIDKLSDAFKKESVTVIVRVIAHTWIGWGRKRVLKAIVEDESGQAALVCFGRPYLESVLIPGMKFIVTAGFSIRYKELQSANFQAEPFDTDGEEFLKIIPIYPLTAGLTQGTMRKIMVSAFSIANNKFDDEIPAHAMRKYGLLSKIRALSSLHFPASFAELEQGRKTLVYEELFYLEVLIGRRSLKKRIKRKNRKPIQYDFKSKLLMRLPFALTGDQEKVLREIESDLFSEYPMSRLLQGDVGCGKTLVALLAVLAIVESGEQATVMAPTELLARQHADKIAGLIEPLGINVGFLSGSVKDDERTRLLAALRSGEIGLLIGTHAVFSDDVVFKNLGLVIIDEQHRFGVRQRLALMKKGENPDLLLMTATPIPRSLALTAFGDLEVSTIKTMPVGRKPVVTHLTKEGNEQKVYERVRKEVESGHQVYFVYPLIEESEKLDLKDAIGMFEKLKKDVFSGYRLALIHSKIADEDKRKVMDAFLRKEIDILVATSVVEVGVDVANATAIVIEHGERFGLSALHQLRGRVGRGPDQSYAFLIYSNKLTPEGIERLKVMMTTTDGFKIAEEDLKLRGPGELLGVRQSGFFRLTISDLTSDRDLLVVARQDAFDLLKRDPGLLLPEHNVVRNVLLKAPPFADEFLDGG